MPVEYTKITGENQIIGVWRIESGSGSTETASQSAVSTSRRGYDRSHSEACRNLMKAMTGWEQVTVLKDKFGKPYLENSHSYISFSHSGHFAAAIYNNDEPVGIDIQELKPKIINIAPKFCSDREMAYLDNEHRVEMLHVIWGVKEAVFKKYGKGEVLFKEHIFVHPFIPGEQGKITVTFSKPEQPETCTFKYQFYEGYCLVYSACHL